MLSFLQKLRFQDLGLAYGKKRLKDLESEYEGRLERLRVSRLDCSLLLGAAHCYVNIALVASNEVADMSCTNADMSFALYSKNETIQQLSSTAREQHCHCQGWLLRTTSAHM